MKLKPCAHCGSEKVSLIEMTRCYKIECLGCSISTTSFDKITAAVKSWNRRATEKIMYKRKSYKKTMEEYPYM